MGARASHLPQEGSQEVEGVGGSAEALQYEEGTGRLRIVRAVVRFVKCATSTSCPKEQPPSSLARTPFSLVFFLWRRAKTLEQSLAHGYPRQLTWWLPERHEADSSECSSSTSNVTCSLLPSAPSAVTSLTRPPSPFASSPSTNWSIPISWEAACHGGDMGGFYWPGQCVADEPAADLPDEGKGYRHRECGCSRLSSWAQVARLMSEATDCQNIFDLFSGWLAILIIHPSYVYYLLLIILYNCIFIVA